MLVSCWSAKGGSGTTVVAAALAVVLSDATRSGVLLVDLAGDLPAVLATPDAGAPGVADWLDAGDDLPPAALGRLEQPVRTARGATRLSLLPRGGSPLRSTQRADALAAALAADPRTVVVDCGLVPGAGPAGDVACAIAGAATHSLLVTRPCYLALRRALMAPIRPSGVVVIDEPGRSFDRSHIEDLLGVPVRSMLELDPQVCRSVDAGLLCSRLPKSLARGLRDAA